MAKKGIVVDYEERGVVDMACDTNVVPPNCWWIKHLKPEMVNGIKIECNDE